MSETKSDIRHPDFVIAGFAKTATTTLAARLATHPRIAFSEPKEPNSYIKPNLPGMTWCAPGTTFGNPPPDALMGEGSVRYGMTHLHPEAAENLAAANPKARLLFVVRDPVKRAVSHWRMLLSDAPDLLSPEEMLDHQWAFDALATTGRYRLHIEHFLKFFPMEQIKVVDFDQITTEFDSNIDGILEFLQPGLNRAGLDAEVSSNVTSSNRFQPTDTLRRLRGLPLWTTATKLVPQALRDTVRSRLHRPPPVPEVSERFIERVREACQDEYTWTMETFVDSRRS